VELEVSEPTVRRGGGVLFWAGSSSGRKRFYQDVYGLGFLNAAEEEARAPIERKGGGTIESQRSSKGGSDWSVVGPVSGEKLNGK